MFVSGLPDGTVLIDDNNWQDYAHPQIGPDGESSTGYIPRNFDEAPRGSIPCASPFPSELLIPRSEWSDWIKQKEENKSRLSDLCTASSVQWLNQSPSWYCWCYTVVQAMMVCNITANNPVRQLVPESVAGPIKNFRKQGGWGSQALEFIAKNGCADTTVWPRESHSQANRRQFYTEEAKANALTNVIEEWWELQTWDEKASCMLRNIPVPSGYGWMGHEMCSIDLVQLGRDSFGCLDLDSYSRNGIYNTKVLEEGRGVGDDMVAPRVTTPNVLT